MIHFHDEGSGPAVVMAHSLTFDSRMWEAQLPELTKRYRVIRVDVHGHGGSGAPDRKFDLEWVADDLIGLLDRLEITTASWVGHSMGGMIGMRAAIRHPERITRLCLLNTSPRSEAPTTRDLFHQVNESSRGKPSNAATVDFIMGLMFSRAFSADHPDVVAPYRELLMQPPQVQGIYRTGHAVIWRSDIRDLLGQIEVPAHVLSSDDDKSTPPKFSKDIAEGIPNATLTSVPGGHMSPVEQADRVTEWLLEALR